MERDLTKEESLSIIRRHILEEESFLGFKNHRKHDLLENTFRFTVDLISLDFLISLMEEPQVVNVYFNPSAPPPGSSIDGISWRYKVYVQYEREEE
jgi:hypothetical protein